MRKLKIAAAQFQPKDGDKGYNLSVIENLTRDAAQLEADVISFHEMCITAYTFTKDLSKEELLDLAEEVPNGSSVQALIQLAKKYKIAILAGLLEDEGGLLYNTYVCVSEEGFVSKFRKLHPFISQYLSPGNEYVVFDLKGWKCGILICYDNNIIENPRATTLLGAEIIFAPHVTMCTPSAMPGRGFVDHQLWENRHVDPVPLRMEFDGPKGMSWLMKWLPARSFDNGVYYVFTNPIGYDGEHLKNGNPLILDPYGNVVTELKSFEDGFCITNIADEKLKLSGGFRYRNARRPELYRHILGQDNDSATETSWMK
ncbi:MAG: nitrilase family protein [Cyclobacteriaceae bacterium]|jgi:predicted amidohydrolase|nr:nitrilase family protein [Cyclobacteriaceae bacterium]